MKVRDIMNTLIFDMGGVLIRWEPEYFIRREEIADPADAALLMDAIYKSPEWPLQDMGELDEAGVEAAALKKLPHRLHAVAHRLIWEWPLEPIPMMANLLKQLKADGFKLYLLSNASVRQPEYWPQISGHEYFDGTVISALEKCVKPGETIFKLLLNRYGLKSSDCIFIDDMPRNVKGAEAVGIRGIRFTGDVEALRLAIEQFRRQDG